MAGEAEEDRSRGGELRKQSTHLQAKLLYVIAYALHRTKLLQPDTYAALVLLQRLNACFPTAHSSSDHRLFIPASTTAFKVIRNNTYWNKSWSMVARGTFTLGEINRMQREMCNYLDWEPTVDNPILVVSKCAASGAISTSSRL